VAKKTKYICDVCEKEIEGEHQLAYKAKVVITGMVYHYDDGHEDYEDVYYCHNDMSNRCVAKLYEMLEKQRRGKR
jgi:hypothetical protein